jgi:methylene-fatty-acyl-phospholipid synthase
VIHTLLLKPSIANPAAEHTMSSATLLDEFTTLAQDVSYLASNFSHYIKLDNQLYYAIACISFNPIFWNIVARLEYNTHFLTKLAGSAKTGCYVLAATIFSLGIYRDHVYHQALLEQPTFQPFVDSVIVKSLAVLTFGFGNVLVLSSMWALGVTGTYLGDYFGILMNERVTGFPFNVNDNPMYNGSTLCFLGTALWYGKPVGILVTLFVFVMYKIALLFEEPFTAKIYANRAKLD